jgi:hypothetical protein
MSTQGGTELRTRGNSYAKLDDRAKLERLLEGDSPDGVDYATFLIHNGITNSNSRYEEHMTYRVTYVDV